LQGVTVAGVVVAVAVAVAVGFRFRYRFKPIQAIGVRATFVVAVAFDNISLHFRELDE